MSGTGVPIKLIRLIDFWLTVRNKYRISSVKGISTYSYDFPLMWEVVPFLIMELIMLHNRGAGNFVINVVLEIFMHGL